MFGGAHELSIDSKGRLAIPAKFRDILLRHYTPSIVVTLDSREKLLMYPEAEWAKVVEQLLRLKTAGNQMLQRYQNLLLHNADTLEWDSAGRVLIPANLRKRVDFEKDVTLSVVPTVWNCGAVINGKLKCLRLWMMILKSWLSN